MKDLSLRGFQLLCVTLTCVACLEAQSQPGITNAGAGHSEAIVIRPGTPEIQFAVCVAGTLGQGGVTTCTVTLTQPVPPGGETVTLVSNNAALAVPASITIAAGTLAGIFSATAAASITSNQSATVTATLGTSSRTVTVSLVAPQLISGITCNPGSLGPGDTGNCTVTLPQPAAAGGSTVLLASSNTALTVPASVAIAAGTSSAAFSVTAAATITSSQSAAVTATLGSTSRTLSVNLVAPVILSGVTCNPASLGPGAASTCRVTLTQPALGGGSTVTLSSNNMALAVPGSVRVTSGATSATFNATAAASLTTSQSAIVTAALGSTSRTATVSVMVPVTISGVACNPTSLGPGVAATCTVTVTQSASAAGSAVTLASDNPALGVPPSITIASGAVSATFSATTAARLTKNQSATVTATIDANSKTATVNLVAPGVISGVTCDATSLSAGAVSTCTITLSAPSTGSTVTLQSNNPLLTVTGAVTVAAGGTSATFPATAAASIPKDQSANVTAVLDGVSTVATISLVAPAALVVSGPSNLATIALGGSISGSLTVSGGVTPYKFAATGVPAGLTFADGRIAGTPSVPGSYSVGITVTDSGNSLATRTISFSVFGIVETSLAPAVTSSSYSATISATGGSPPYTFSGSGLPPKFSLSTAGLLTGTATDPGTYTITVAAKDSNGVANLASFPLSVTAPPLKVPGGPLSDSTVLVSNSQDLSANGGQPPYTWTLAGGALPDGMSLLPKGTISGTPNHTGAYTFTVKATDAAGTSSDGAYSINVIPAPVTITTPSPLPSGMINVDYPVQGIAASGGVAPYTFKVTSNALPSGLTLSPSGRVSGTPTVAGTSTFTITAMDSRGQTGTAALQIAVRPFSADLIVSAGSLSFSLTAGAASLPGAQTVQVQSSDVTIALTYSTAIPTGASWLSVSPGGTTPGSFSVALTGAASLLAASATPYQATIGVACTAPSGCVGSQSVAVSLVVTAAPARLTVLTDVVSFAASATVPVATSQNIGVRNAGGGSLDFTSVTCPPVWCKVGLVPASLAGGVSGVVNVTADPGVLSPGYYYANLTIVTSAGNAVVPITFFIAADSSITLNPSGVQLTMTAGGAAAVPDTSFLVNVPGTSTLAWTATVLPGAPWLKLGVASGTSTGVLPSTISYSIDQIAAAGLASQAYYGTIRVVAPGAVNSPQDFQVVLNVTAATEKAKPAPTPAGLLFISSGTATAPPQTVNVFASSVPVVNYQASVATDDGKPWLAVTPLTGSTSVASPAKTSVTVSPAGLAPGIYHGTVSFSFSAAAVPGVNVTLLVQAAVPASAARPAGLRPLLEASAADAGPPLCTATQLVPTQTGLVNNFAAAASWPTPLEILLVNDCGAPVTTGQITATFSNGDAPLIMRLADTASGRYSGTWTPHHTGSQVIVTATATAPGLTAATAQITGAVVPNNAPFLNHNGTLHIFSPQVGAPLAPGTIVQIYGSSLATETTSSTTMPLATSLAGTSVIIGGVQAPLFFVSPGQVNAQIPFELAPGQTYQVIVSNNGALTTPDSLQATAVTPGVAALPSGVANAQHASDGSSITKDSPARPGEFVVVYLAGMGMTTVPVATGAGAPADPLARTRSAPTITLNSAPVSFVYSGLTPGLAGLYQIDLQVPADAPDGDLTLVVNQPGFEGTSVILPVHQ